MRDPKVYILDMYKGTGIIKRLSHFIKYTSTEDRIYLICIDKEVDECWVSIPKFLKNEKVIISWDNVENDDLTLRHIIDIYPYGHDIFPDSD